MAAKGNTYILARWTHQAAREGTVPLCEDDIRNPTDPAMSPHSGLMRQPTKEEPVSELLDFTYFLEIKSLAAFLPVSGLISLRKSLSELLPRGRCHQALRTYPQAYLRSNEGSHQQCHTWSSTVT